MGVGGFCFFFFVVLKTSLRISKTDVGNGKEVDVGDLNKVYSCILDKMQGFNDLQECLE